ncbi:MAG: TPM domain-containing protein [Microbacterium sp.]
MDGYVTDASDVLTPEEEASLEQQLSDLASTDGVPELYVMFIDEFTDPANGPNWVDQAAEDEFLGQDQYLLAIATEQRGMAMSYGNDGPLSANRVDAIMDGLATEHLSNDEWAAAVELAIEEFEKKPWPWWVWMLLVAGLAVVIVGGTAGIRWARRAAARRAELATLDGQKERAARELVRADDAVRSSSQELGFVTAEFDGDQTAPFEEVLSDAREKLARAFELQGKLEDAIEDTVEETRSWTDEILSTCTAIHAQLRAKKKDLDRLRDLVSGADASLSRLTEQRRAADATLAAAERRLATLSSAYEPADVAIVADVPEEIRLRLADADAALSALADAAQARRGGAITRSIHAVEEALAEVSELHDDVDERAEALAARATAGAGSTITADAPVEPRERPAPVFAPTPGAAPELASAEAALARAHRTVESRERDPAARSTAIARCTALARESLNAADAARPSDPAGVERHARTALDRAEIAKRLVPGAGRPTSHGRSAPSTSSSTTASRGRVGAKAAMGAVGGGAVGGFAGLGAAAESESPALIVVGVVVGALIGSLSSAFGGNRSRGSSSGWHSSSRHRSSFRSGSSRSRSSGGSRRSSSSGGGRSSSGRRF